MTDPIHEFSAWTQERGLILQPGDVIADGKLHRCDVEAKGCSGKGDGAYVLHMDGHPAGGCENHRDGIGWENWSATRQKPMTAAERMALQIKIEEQRREREAEEAKRRAETREAIREIVSSSPYATDDHPYSKSKGVSIAAWKIRQYCGSLHLAGMACDGSLVVPLYALPTPDAKLDLSALQFISPAGDKRFMGPVGGCFFPIGRPKPEGALLICEGLSTGLSLHEATESPVVVALTCGNLVRVGSLMRLRYGAKLDLIYCADDDQREAA